ncbi:hypothetical protein ASG73_02455 [Janibacter sp. Soil728]|uniref:hypothetical protein n=1 Tax=Janibacter sp. Soil728 TaxID=1736393 RepID=UPI00070122C2|nr:hypothetical protein [Janibacter sp. Soil728]KRE39220.1 hypothetical protein ASG73_02455 [Janibacter sp. Soil728]
MTADFCAWGDESMRRSARGEGAVYFLGAAIIDMDDYDTCRSALLALPRSGPKLHWHGADSQRRRRVMAAVETLPAQHVVVIAAPTDPARQQRARAKCVERMLHELELYGATRLVMETRTPSLNDRDMKLIDRLRGARRIPSGIRLEFGLPSQEPLLWLPDQVLGAIGLSEAGEQRWLTEAMAARVHRVDITLE